MRGQTLPVAPDPAESKVKVIRRTGAGEAVRKELALGGLPTPALL